MAETHRAQEWGEGDFDWWSQMTCSVIPTVLSSPHTADFHAHAHPVDLSILRASIIRAPTVRSVRTAATIRRLDPELWQILLVTHGRATLTQHGNQVLLATGDVALFDTSHPYEIQTSADGQSAGSIMAHLPRTMLPIPDRSLRALAAQRLPCGSGTGAALRHLLRELAGMHAVPSPRTREHLGPAVVNLSAAFLADLTDSRNLTSEKSRQEALRSAIRTFIEHHLADPQLTPRLIAGAHHISVSYLHHLFQDSGYSVGALIRRRRLERARRDLTDPTLPIAKVGARWGMPDAAVFNRSFKGAYGLPPGQYRRRLASNDSGGPP